MVISTNTRDVSDYLQAEAERAGQLVASGLFLNVWPKADMTGAIVLVDAADESELRRGVESMPTVVAGAADYQVIPLLDPGVS